VSVPVVLNQFNDFPGLSYVMAAGEVLWIGVYCENAPYSSGDPVADHKTMVWAQGTYPTVPEVYNPIFAPYVTAIEAAIYATYTPTAAPPQGTLEVHAYEDGVEVGASVESEAGTYTTPFTIPLNVGLYTLNATYGIHPPQTQTVEILEGQTTIVDFNFVLPPTHLLTVDSVPIQGIPFTIEEMQTQQLSGVLANSGSARDIQIAVDEAVAQGLKNVHIPEGTFNFVAVGEPWMTVIIPAGINFFGAPTQRTSGLPEPSRGMSPNNQVIEWKTVLRMPNDVDDNGHSSIPWFFRIIGDGVQPFRFSDIKLVGYRSIDPTSKNWHGGIRMENVPSFRIDHCFFEHTTGAAAWSLQCSGIVDHSWLVNYYGAVAWPYLECDMGYGIKIDGKNVWISSIEDVLGKHTDQTVFIEDCYISRWRHTPSGAFASHFVIRHNTFEYDSVVGTIDAHGWRMYTSESLSQRAMEIYNNEIIDPVLNWQPNYDSKVPANGASGYGVFWRGGGGVAFNNYIRGYHTGFHLTLEDLNENVPESNRINDLWIWNNTGENIGYKLVHAYGGPIENINYFLRAPNLAEDGFEYTPYPYPHPLTVEGPVTPWTRELEERTYRITMPLKVVDGEKIWKFVQWEDGSTNPARTIDLTAATTVSVAYELTSIINGKVVDAKTGQPIISAQVECNEKQAVTDELGNYIFSDLPPNIYTINVSAAGYTGQSVEVDASAGGTFTQDFSLTLSPLPINKTALALGTVAIVSVVGAVTYIGQKKKR